MILHEIIKLQLFVVKDDNISLLFRMLIEKPSDLAETEHCNEDCGHRPATVD